MRLNKHKILNIVLLIGIMMSIGGTVVFAATRNIVPRADTEGSLGTTAKAWGSIHSVNASSTLLTTTTSWIGTVLSGIWNGTAITDTYLDGITLASGSLTLAGADALTITTSGATGVTFPTSGTMAILGGNVFTGVHDFGGATSFEIVNGASPTVDTLGEIALDTTDNQLLIATSTTPAVVRTDEKLFSFTVASTTPEWFSGGSIPVPLEKDGYTVTSLGCYVTSGTSVVLTLSDGTNDMDSLTCATTATTDTALTNGVVTANELMQIKVGAITGVVDYASFSAYGTWTRE